MLVVKNWIRMQNIERFRRQLASAQDESQRAVLSELLAQEEAMLEGPGSPATPGGPPAVDGKRS